MIALLAIVWQILGYFSLPHLVELPGIIESWLTYKGLVYYKDFATFHFPLGRWVMLPFYLASNWNLEAGPLVALLTSIIGIWLLKKTFKDFFDSKGFVVAVIFFSIFNWFLATGIVFYHEMFIGLLLLVCLHLLLQIQKDKFKNFFLAFLLGVMLILTLLSGQIAAITLLNFALVYLLMIWKNKIEKKVAIKSVVWICAGISLPLVIFIGYFVKNKAVSEMIFWNIDYYKTYSGDYEKISFLQLPLIELVAFYMPLAALLVLNTKKVLQKKLDMYALSMLILALSTIPFIFFSVFHFHHVSYALPVFSFLAGYCFVQLNKQRKIRLLLTLVFVFFVSTSIVPWYLERLQLFRPLKIINDTHPGDEMYEAVEWIKTNSNGNEKILVAGDPLFYFSSRRIPSNKHMYVSPYNWQPLSLIQPDVEENRPNYWIVDSNFMVRLKKEYKRDDMVIFIEGQLNTCYKKLFDNQSWQIWKNNCN